MRRPSAGRLRHRIDVEQKSPATADEFGADDGAWTTLLPAVPAECENLPGYEDLAGKQAQSYARWSVLLRFHPSVNSSLRFRFVDPRNLHLLYPTSVLSDTTNCWLSCECVEHLAVASP